MRVVKLWHRLPGDMVDVPFLAVSMAKLDGPGSNLAKGEVPMEGRVRSIEVPLPSQVKPFYERKKLEGEILC